MNMINNQKIIADTCVWIEFFRTKSEISNRMKNFIANNLVVGTGIIIAELLQGTKTYKEREIIRDIFDTLDYIEITRDIWLNAGNLANELRTAGKTIPLTDIIIASCALKYNCRIFTIDKHFQEIPRLKEHLM